MWALWLLPVADTEKLPTVCMVPGRSQEQPRPGDLWGPEKGRVEGVLTE